MLVYRMPKHLIDNNFILLYDNFTNNIIII